MSVYMSNTTEKADSLRYPLPTVPEPPEPPKELVQSACATVVNVVNNDSIAIILINNATIFFPIVRKVNTSCTKFEI